MIEAIIFTRRVLTPEANIKNLDLEITIVSAQNDLRKNRLNEFAEIRNIIEKSINLN
jgi:hypothetical protein